MSVYFLQSSTVRSVLNESTTTISSHHVKLLRHASILSSSLNAVMQALIFRLSDLSDMALVP